MHKMPKMETRFSINVVGEETKVNYMGEFVYRRPNLSERSLIETMRARLSGDLRTVSADIDDHNIMVSHLRWTLKEFPDWWKAADFGGALWDANVVREIYKKCSEFEDEFRKKILSGEPKDVEVSTEPDTNAVVERAAE